MTQPPSVALTPLPTESPAWVHHLELDVQIFDTDCFGVMWHGAYTKWMELGRVKLLNAMGVSIDLPGEVNGYVYPVAEQNLKFKNKAPYAEPLRLTTRLTIQGLKMIFHQTFRSRKDEKITLDAETTVLILDSDWKIQRRTPEFIHTSLLNAHEQYQSRELRTETLA